jgi:hypothetical protein
MKCICIQFLGVIVLMPMIVFAHGGDKPGPHGGAIQMPGAFHTEVVDKKNGSLEIFLLDLNFKNPSIKDSGLKVFSVANGSKTELKCTVGVEKYICLGKLPESGKLHVTAKREQMQGNEAVYDLPIKPGDGGGM